MVFVSLAKCYFAHWCSYFGARWFKIPSPKPYSAFRIEHMKFYREIRNTGPLECSPPSLPYVSDRLVGIAWTRKEKWASPSLLVFPFAKDLARLSSQRKRLCRLTRLQFASIIAHQLINSELPRRQTIDDLAAHVGWDDQGQRTSRVGTIRLRSFPHPVRDRSRGRRRRAATPFSSNSMQKLRIHQWDWNRFAASSPRPAAICGGHRPTCLASYRLSLRTHSQRK